MARRLTRSRDCVRRTLSPAQVLFGDGVWSRWSAIVDYTAPADEPAPAAYAAHAATTERVAKARLPQCQ